VDVEPKLRGDDPGQQMAFLLRWVHTGRRLPLDIFGFDQELVLTPAPVKLFVDAPKMAQYLVPPASKL
jgi:hypothetical protein